MRSTSSLSARRAFHRRQMLAVLGWLTLFAAVVTVFALLSRPHLPPEAFAEAKVVRDKLAATYSALQAHRNEFDRHANARSRQVADAVAAEQLRQLMTTAGETYAGAVALFNGEISQLLHTNVIDDLPRLNALFDHTLALAGQAERLAESVAARARILAFVEAQPAAAMAEMTAAPGEIERLADALGRAVETASQRFPHKAHDLRRRLAGIDTCPPPPADAALPPVPKGAPAFPPPAPAAPACTGDARAGLARAQAADWRDLAQVADRYTEMRGRVAHALRRDTDTRERIADLPLIWAIRLTDMGMNCYASFTAYSWNESSESEGANWPLPRREIPCDAYVALNALGEESPVPRNGSKISYARLGIANVLPMSGHNTVEVYVADLDAKFRQQLTTYNNGALTSAWGEVDEDTFIEHQNDLGMDIKVKPAGLYADEALTEASPPGLALVGEPDTGRWEQQGQGHRIWAWHPAFQSFFTPTFVNGSRHAWDEDEWRMWTETYRGRAPYYGKKREEERSSSSSSSGGGGGGGGGGGCCYDWGSDGQKTRDTPGYKDSTYRKTNVPRLPEESVRGAGESSRGGGPGGGGK